MPLLEPSEVVALGLSPKDIPAHKPQSPRKNVQGASHVGHGATRVTSTQTTRRRGPRNLVSTSSYSSRSTTSASNSASPTLSTSRFAFVAGAEIGRDFEVCISVPSKRKLAVLQRYERFPDADMATKEARIEAEEFLHDERLGEPSDGGLSEGPASETLVSDSVSPAIETSIGLVEEGQSEVLEKHSMEPNGSSYTDVDASDKQPVLEPGATIVPIANDFSL